MVVSKHAKKKRREETTPFGVISMRSRVLYWAAHVWNMHCDTQPPICIGCRHGFVGILLLAAWPNAAFDLCGICCGHFLMPFWDFFGATFIGKALLKVHPPSCLPESSVHVVVYQISVLHVVLPTAIQTLQTIGSPCFKSM